MTLLIHWSQQARADLLAIVRYISERDPDAARKLRDCIVSAVATTGDHPYLYKPGRIAGTRELIAHPNYIAELHRCLQGRRTCRCAGRVALAPALPAG